MSFTKRTVPRLCLGTKRSRKSHGGITEEEEEDRGRQARTPASAGTGWGPSRGRLTTLSNTILKPRGPVHPCPRECALPAARSSCRRERSRSRSAKGHRTRQSA
eukprot:9497550-Pyramimonas_sp.AAC.1